MKKEQYDYPDAYYIFMNDRLMKLAPVVGGSAAITFTIARLRGLFSFASIPGLIGFDLACFSYFIVAYILRKIGIVRDGAVSEKAMEYTDLVLDALIVFQWNLITYIFPTRTFWGYAPMFVLLSAFMFHTKAVRNEIIGISVSIVISWLINGDMLLPYKDEFFTKNMVLRCVALFISFSVIYILTFYAEKFTRLVKENIRSIEEKSDELENMGRDVIDFTADLIEERDVTSGSHVKRLKENVRLLAEEVARQCPEYNLTKEKINEIALASVLHDAGKIGVPDSILMKPGKLTAEEFEIMKSHTTIGARIIDKLPDSVGTDYKKYCREICLFHHEKYDGNGYPSGLKGNDIPISAQIVSVIDCFDALTNERPYKRALPAELAINMILNGECGIFSEQMKQCIISCRDRLTVR